MGEAASQEYLSELEGVSHSRRRKCFQIGGGMIRT